MSCSLGCDSTSYRKGGNQQTSEESGHDPVRNVGLGTISETQQASQESEADKIKKADIRILFIGNSHTYFHSLPNLVARMMERQHPDKKVYARTVGVEFLEEVGNDPMYRKELESQPWNFVVLQAQKISMSGKFDYSKQEGIDFAKLAKSRGATVYFYSEWGRRGVDGDGATIEKIYEAMAQAAEVSLAPVGRAWDIALAEKPDLAIYAVDGNHQSEIGAFLTAAVFCGQLTGESPASLGAFRYKLIDQTTRELLASAAAKALKTRAEDLQRP